MRVENYNSKLNAFLLKSKELKFAYLKKLSTLNSQLSTKYLTLILTTILASCATVVPPSGGPEDKLPPRISGTTLAPNSINQSTNLDLTLQFDEWIDKKSLTGAVAISPPISGRLQLKADGSKLRIYSTEPLDSNTTYTLTVTNTIKDLRNNPLEKPFQILFSTGNFLDSLKTDFSVQLHDSLTRKKNFPVVAFYPIGKIRMNKNYLGKFRDSALVAEADTIPRVTKEIPQYIAQTDSLGNGSLQGMQAGLYLAVAFLDGNKNQRLDAESEIAGVAEFPFELNEEKKLLRFSLGDLDTSSLTLDAVSQRGNSEIEFSFSRHIVLDSLNCFFATSKDTLSPSGFYAEPNSKNPVLLFDNLKNDSLYSANCLYARDSLGRTLDTARASAKFRFKKIPENEAVPTVISKIEPSRGTDDILPGTPIKLFYNHPVSADTLAFRLYVNEDSVNVEVKQANAVSLEISANPAWVTDAKIKLALVEKDSVVDTLYREKILSQFSTISRLKLASLKGKIPDGNASTVVVLQEIVIRKLPKTTMKSLGKEWKAQCDASGNFEFRGLPKGSYKLMYFKDLNGDGRLTSGSIYPLQAGEPWGAPEEELTLDSGENIF
ncbi:MAG: Ig-like domain-containing protein [Fibromonadales bacterium]|nr:Ig-like domain-containing protein [Fibromonadales bacterium]